MSKVSLDTIKPWITQRVTQLLGVEDDVVVEFVFNLLEKKQVSSFSLPSPPPLLITSFVTPLLSVPPFVPFNHQFPDPRELQLNLTGFLHGKNARIFMQELWELLTSAQESIGGIPTKFLEQKKEEIRQKKVGREIALSFEGGREGGRRVDERECGRREGREGGRRGEWGILSSKRWASGRGPVRFRVLGLVMDHVTPCLYIIP